MNRIHTTNSETILLDRTYQQHMDTKPYGIWYAFDNSWLDWSNRNMPDKIGNNIFELDIKTEKILVISDVEDLKKLCDKYSGKDFFCLIQWDKVAEDYDGIEFHNYKKLRFNIPIHEDLRMIWIAGLDVSSGCIWNLNSINSFNKINISDKWK